jgi:hypothetical protein
LTSHRPATNKAEHVQLRRQTTTAHLVVLRRLDDVGDNVLGFAGIADAQHDASASTDKRTGCLDTMPAPAPVTMATWTDIKQLGSKRTTHPRGQVEALDDIQSVGAGAKFAVLDSAAADVMAIQEEGEFDCCFQRGI